MPDVSIEELEPYLNPDYWSGHSLGYGEALDDSPESPKIRTPRQIRGVFEERMAAMERIVPIETLNTGETFDAANYHQGTVLMFRKEELRGDPSQLEVDVEALRGQPIPSRPTEFALAIGRAASQSEFLVTPNARYNNRVYCGMVGEGEDGKNVIYATSASLIERLGGGRIMTAGSIWMTYPKPIEIGNTVHAKTKTGELVQRVNLLEVVAYGETERQKEKAKGFMGRLAFRHQAT